MHPNLTEIYDRRGGWEYAGPMNGIFSPDGRKVLASARNFYNSEPFAKTQLERQTRENHEIEVGRQGHWKRDFYNLKNFDLQRHVIVSECPKEKGRKRLAKKLHQFVSKDPQLDSELTMHSKNEKVTHGKVLSKDFLNDIEKEFCKFFTLANYPSDGNDLGALITDRNGDVAGMHIGRLNRPETPSLFLPASEILKFLDDSF